MQVGIMGDPLQPKNLTSPFPTGGGGSDYERLVGATYLAMALLRSVPRGLDGGTAREVRFQRLYEGQSLDDLVVIADLPNGEAKLALQIKRDLAFGEANTTFQDVMRACWQTFKSPRFNAGQDRFGVVIGLYSKRIDEHFQSVLTWARSSANAKDFLSRVSQGRLSNKTQIGFVKLIRTTLDACSGDEVGDDDLWNFLRSMVILHFDFQQSGSRDYAYAVEVLKYALSAHKEDESSRLFAQLTGYSAEANRTAGSFDSDTLRERLLADGFTLRPTPNCKDDLDRLREHAGLVMADIRTDIGGLVLNRVPLVVEAKEKIRTASLLEIIGRPGSGKSAILKALAESHQAEGPAIVLAADRLTSAVGWNGFARDLRLDRRLQEILLAISGSSSPCLFINDVDRITEPGARKVINDLVRAVAAISISQNKTGHWSVVVCARDENLQQLHDWFDWRALGQPETLMVPNLTREEISIIAGHSPRLRPLLSHKQLDDLIGNPFMLRLLEDQRMKLDLGALPRIATEIEVSQVWWNKLVGSDGVVGLARQQALLEFGRRNIRSPGAPLSADGVQVEALYSLALDGILKRDVVRDLYRFTHDLLEDWTLHRVLDSRRGQLAAYLIELGQPIGLLRAVQLLGLFMLEYDSADVWAGLVEQLEQTPGLAPRWRQALLTAPLLSSRANALLDNLESFLVDDGAKRLIDLMTAVRTSEVMPDFSILPVAERMAERPEEVIPILMSWPIPRWHVWLPLIGWLAKRLESLPRVVRPEALNLMELWQQKSPKGSVYRKEIGEIALGWLEEIERK